MYVLIKAKVLDKQPKIGSDIHISTAMNFCFYLTRESVSKTKDRRIFVKSCKSKTLKQLTKCHQIQHFYFLAACLFLVRSKGFHLPQVLFREHGVITRQDGLFDLVKRKLQVPQKNSYPQHRKKTTFIVEYFINLAYKYCMPSFLPEQKALYSSSLQLRTEEMLSS